VFCERKGKVYGESWTNADVIGCAMLMDANQSDLYFFKNGQLQGLAASGVRCTMAWHPAVSLFGPGTELEVNFGPRFEFEPTGLPETLVGVSEPPQSDSIVAPEPEEKRTRIDENQPS
jgi:hypothetical protein